MFQPPEVGHVAEPAAEAGHAASEAFNAGDTIIGHVANSPIDHPLIHLPPVFGIDMSITKHVFMLWAVSALLLAVVTLAVRRYTRGGRMVPSGPIMGLIEYVVLRMRDDIAAPAMGRKWVDAYTPLLLTFFLFIVASNAIGMVPIFDALALLNHTVLHLPEEAFLTRLTHGGVTATGNFNVTAGLATVTFFAIIIAGVRSHGFVGHWKNLVPHGVHPVMWVLLIPLEIIGMFVRPFALTMRLAANMTGGHIALLAILSMVFIMTELTKSATIGMGIGLMSLPLTVGISLLELMIVVPVQAYVFTLLTAVFIGMAIHAHH
jgi:F-type H+-transporting ATPase subunit a